jgi:hypothetical protein
MIIKAILYTENLQMTEGVLYDNLPRTPMQDIFIVAPCILKIH